MHPHATRLRTEHPPRPRGMLVSKSQHGIVSWRWVENAAMRSLTLLVFHFTAQRLARRTWTIAVKTRGRRPINR